MKPARIVPSVASGFLLCHLNLTGRKLFKNSSPTGISTISVLSLSSDNELIDVWLHLKVEMELFPSVIVLDTVALVGSTSNPMQILLPPVVKTSPALTPIKVFLFPVEIFDPLLCPMEVLSSPVVICLPASFPIVVQPQAEVIFVPA